jgi:hypothetical protein
MVDKQDTSAKEAKTETKGEGEETLGQKTGVRNEFEFGQVLGRGIPDGRS